ncbi:flagellar hook-basal body complex protein FliE [Spirochaeta isovalerica]|uniref:Flagellar hook-basal body complex protein FliE n=1 Tax=Spirochaeta isovalerica TaxID=150 RepID=A0A841RI33_9SPIO|nr:flagellar hook-basal body complex protein FliE [Spirochaeta isovalerica]MBB6481962.1 flagellar hook-basal body complex protein FliE [Spirochaeta isovalerica]
MSLMNLVGADSAFGDVVQLKRSRPRHLNEEGLMTEAPAKTGKFGEMVVDALNSANNAEQDSAGLMQQMITDPDSVDVHDVTIAMAKAEMAVNLTKSVIDGAVKAYKEIISTR